VTARRRPAAGCRMCGGAGARPVDPARLPRDVAAWIRRDPVLCPACVARLGRPRRPDEGRAT